MGQPHEVDDEPVTELVAARRARAGLATSSARMPRRCVLTPARPSAPDTALLADGQGYLHDIRHQIATLVMLVSALDVHTGIEGGSALADHLLTESRRLDELLAAMARHPSNLGVGPGGAPPPTVRLDELVRGLTAPFRALDGPTLQVLVTAVVVRHDHLLLWRALRNVLDNARTAAGPAGHIVVRLFARDGFAILDVDDDGPGLPSGPLRRGGRGLTIADTLARGWGGWLELSTGRLGGCRARLFVPIWRDDAGGS